MTYVSAAVVDILGMDEAQACAAGRTNSVSSKAALKPTIVVCTFSSAQTASAALKCCWHELMYLCKNCWVKRKTATVGLQHGHVLLY